MASLPCGSLPTSMPTRSPPRAGAARDLGTGSRIPSTATASAAQGDALRLFDQETKQLEQDHASLLRAVKNGLHSDAVINELNAVHAKLELRSAEREAMVPVSIELPEDLPTLYRDFVASITGALSDGSRPCSRRTATGC